LGCIV
jgi:hypothetical protein